MTEIVTGLGTPVTNYHSEMLHLVRVARGLERQAVVAILKQEGLLYAIEALEEIWEKEKDNDR